MPGATELEWAGEVVSQVWEWWFLKFDVTLRNYGTPRTAPCTMAKLMATRSPPPSTLRQLCFLLAMEFLAMQKVFSEMLKANNAPLVCFACARLLVYTD